MPHCEARFDPNGSHFGDFHAKVGEIIELLFWRKITLRTIAKSGYFWNRQILAHTSSNLTDQSL